MNFSYFGESAAGEWVFVAGHTYLARIEARVGYPHAAEGDFGTFAEPVGTGVKGAASVTIVEK